MARCKFIENHILREVVFSIEVVNMPTNVIVFVANKDSFKSLWTTFFMKLQRDGNKTLTPPYTQMGEIRFGFVHNLIWSGVCWQYRCGNSVVKIIYHQGHITPE